MVDPKVVLQTIPAVVATTAVSVTLYRDLRSLRRERLEENYRRAARELLSSWQTSTIEFTNIDPLETTVGTYFTDASRWVGGFKRELLGVNAHVTSVDNIFEVSTTQDIITIGGPASRVLARISLSYDENGRLEESSAPRFVYGSVSEGQRSPDIVESYDWGRTVRKVPANSVVDLNTGREYFPRISGDRLKTDLCLLTVRPNPFNVEYRHWILGGTNGVSAVAFGKALFEKNFVTRLWQRTDGARFFQALLECPVEWIAAGGYDPRGVPRIVEVVPITPGWKTAEHATALFRRIAELKAGRRSESRIQDEARLGYRES
jgi:hypothetical protein